MNARRILIAFIVIAVLAAFAFILLRPQDTQVDLESEDDGEVLLEDNMNNDSILEGDTESQDESMMLDVTTINMTGNNFSFDPSVIKVKVGEKVKVVLNAVDMPHDFVVDELDVRTDIAQPGETVEVEFTATEVGEYEYYCSVGQHRANGMVGTLTVTE